MGVRTQCPKCLAMVWPKEKDACCGGGRRVLDERYNPPLRPEYRALLQSPHVSFNSRILNSTLALGSQGTFPSREHGGLGMFDEGLAFLHLMGKAYLVLRTPQEGCNPCDTHMHPKEVLFDRAARDCNPHANINTRLEGGEADMPRSAVVVNSLPLAPFCQNYTL